MGEERTIFVVDDDAAIRDSLVELLEASGYLAKAFGSAGAFLANGAADRQGCVIADIRMPDMDGLELQEEMKKHGSTMPVIIMTGHGDVPLAVRAMKAGAVDFLEKPCEPAILLESIDRAMAVRGSDAGDCSEEVQGKLQALTPREKEVLDMIVAGKLNKVIAYELSISPRTVEIHRARLMHKLGVRNLAELMRMLLIRGASKA